MELIAVILLVLLVLFGEIGLYRRNGLKGLSYRCRFSETECTEGDSLQFVETVSNEKGMPVPWLKAELTTSCWLDFPETNSSQTGENRFVTSFFSVRGHAKVSRVWNITCEKRGAYEMEHVVLVTSDLLGVVRLSLQAEDTGGTLLVLPQRMTEAGLILPRLLHQQFGDQSVRHSLLTDPCLSAGVREYVPGDPLHRMHWKASAHAGTLLMRREEHTAQQTVTVLLALESHSPDSGIMTQDEALLEHTIRVCAQCLWEFFRNGWQVRLCIGERRKKTVCRSCRPMAAAAECTINSCSSWHCSACRRSCRSPRCSPCTADLPSRKHCCSSHRTRTEQRRSGNSAAVVWCW